MVNKQCADGKTEEEACEVLKITLDEYLKEKKLLKESVHD